MKKVTFTCINLLKNSSTKNLKIVHFTLQHPTEITQNKLRFTSEEDTVLEDNFVHNIPKSILFYCRKKRTTNPLAIL
jgi:hypothetical protein